MTCIPLPNIQKVPDNEKVNEVIESVLRNDEYTVLKILSSLENKDDFLSFLKDFENSLILKFNPQSAKKIYENIRKCYAELKSNTSLKLVASNLCGGIFWT
jgi:hypothetical protein